MSSRNLKTSSKRNKKKPIVKRKGGNKDGLKSNTTLPSLLESTQKITFKRFEGSILFRYRIVFATLTHTPIEIDNIRNDGNNSDKMGLNDCEISFLRLMDQITNGSLIEINETGTRIRYRPGSIVGANGKTLVHDCVTSRSVVYWLEPMLILLPFAREQTHLTLMGATYHELDISIDVVRGVLIPTLKRHFGITDIRIDLKRRALPPSGGGEISITIPIIKQLRAFDSIDVGMIKRIRGLCYTVAMAPTIANRVRTSANEILYRYISDVWIFNDKTTRFELQKNLPKETQNSIAAGYGLSLIAESTSGVMLSVHQQCNNTMTAEEFGTFVSKLLLQEVSYGGTVDTTLQSLIMIFMALCPEDVSRIRLGRLSQHTAHVLRLMKEMLGVTFKLREDNETGTIFASCMGIGFSNVWRQAS